MTTVEATKVVSAILFAAGTLSLVWAGVSLSWIRLIVAFTFFGLSFLFSASALALKSHEGDS